LFYSRLAGFAGEILNLTEAPEKLLNLSGASGLPALFSFFYLRTLRVRSPRNLNSKVYS